MSKIKLPDANYLASFVRAMKANNETCCGTTAGGLCNSSTVLTAYALKAAAMKLDFYHGNTCPHGHPTSGGQLGYLLENYAAPAIKADCDPSWKSLLRGSVAILMYYHAYGDPHYNPLDLWSIDNCFHPQIMEQSAAQGIWIWTLGNVTSPKIHTKHAKPKAKHAPVIF